MSYLSSQDLGLTRFAGNAIHQNVSHSNVTLNIRAVDGKRLGRATTNDLSDDGIRRSMEAAKRNALLMPEDPAFPWTPGAAAGGSSGKLGRIGRRLLANDPGTDGDRGLPPGGR